ncbi:5-hydroxytryptamine receptor 7 isoform X2 [Atheta coriaria]|uniref:5-hydroxytryptamine receptor 7 isoform X2 n=1 Tax=Dalotia coriaria TaxID=877792 RepID=UPI0031F43819
MDYILSLYGCVFLVGVLGNGSLGLALCSGPGAKNRSPLLLGMVAADFFVCCIAGPVTAATYAVSSWSNVWWRIAQFLQAWPVSASTLSMMAISMDRYLTVKNYRPATQVVRRRPLLLSVVAATWLSAAAFSGLQFVQRDNTLRRTFLVMRVVCVHVVPACAVLASHLGVHAKLTALSLTARAKHGELPLPMPLLRRPTHVIIVAGIPNRMEAEERRGTNGVRKNGRNGTTNAGGGDEVDDVTQPPTSTLRSRRRLANSLLWVAFVFAACWLPHVVCLIYAEAKGEPPPILVARACLLVGHMHSAVSPLLYWSLNHQWLQRPCRFRLPALYRSASSTNEAALGPFNPRLVRPPPVRRRSSHYLY